MGPPINPDRFTPLVKLDNCVGTSFVGLFRELFQFLARLLVRLLKFGQFLRGLVGGVVSQVRHRLAVFVQFADEFRQFLIDGVALSQDQKVAIAAAIQRAGIEALGGAQVRLTNPVYAGHVNPNLRPEWYGIWVIDGPFGNEVGGKINDIGFYQ